LGRSAVASSAYRSGEKIKNEYDGVTHDYTNRSSVSASAYRSGEKVNEHDFTNKRGVVHTEIMLPVNAPAEFQNRATLWNAVEKTEKRRDAQTAREINVALPIEFDRQEQINIMREYIQDNFVDKGMIADFAIHDKGDGNPHAHILLTTRDVDKNGFGKKNRDWNSKQYLQQWRENWADKCNDRLKDYAERIDHRTLEAQGIDREPTIHIGVTAKSMERRGIESERVKENREIIARNESRKNINPENIANYIHELKEGYIMVDKEVTTMQQDISEARREIHSLKTTAENIHERAVYIQSLNGKIKELQSGRQRMGIFENKKLIDSQITQLERAREQAENAFFREYKIKPEQAPAEIKRLDDRARSLGHLQETLQNKIMPFSEKKNIFMIEYQRQKLLAELNPNEQNIYDKLEELNQGNSAQTTRERLSRVQSERVLDIVTEHNFDEILKDMQPNQIEKLIKNRLQEIEREYIITRSR